MVFKLWKSMKGRILLHMCFNWRKYEDNSSQTIRLVRIMLLVLIIVGVGLLLTQDSWVPKVVDFLL